MKVGTTSMLVAKQVIDISLIDSVIWTIKGSQATIEKVYPGVVTYDGQSFNIPFTQEETTKLGPGFVKAEGQLNFKNKNVAKTNQIHVVNESTLGTHFLPGNKPGEDSVDFVSVSIIGELVIGHDGRDGADGFSPTVEVEEITGGHTVSITDAEGTTDFDVMNGKDGGCVAFEIDSNGDLICVTETDNPSAVYSIDENGDLILTI